MEAELARKTNNFMDSYVVYKWYNTTRQRWEVRLRCDTGYYSKIYHSEAEADDYITFVKSHMKGLEKVFLPKGKYNHRKESTIMLDEL